VPAEPSRGAGLTVTYLAGAIADTIAVGLVLARRPT
jgi:hypothetical protein